MCGEKRAKQVRFRGHYRLCTPDWHAAPDLQHCNCTHCIEALRNMQHEFTYHSDADFDVCCAWWSCVREPACSVCRHPAALHLYILHNLCKRMQLNTLCMLAASLPASRLCTATSNQATTGRPPNSSQCSSQHCSVHCLRCGCALGHAADAMRAPRITRCAVNYAVPVTQVAAAVGAASIAH